MKRSKEHLIEMARSYWLLAERASVARKRSDMSVSLLAMGCCMAAIEGSPLDEDIERLARDGGILL